MDTKTHWDESHQKHPDKRDPSNYAVDKEKSFPRGSIVCDLGGGDGTDSLFFLKQGHSVFHCDISPVAVEKARRKIDNAGIIKNFSTEVVDLNKDRIPKPDNFFDVIYSRLSLHYFDKDRTGEILADIKRVLKPGGVAFIAVKSPNDKDEMEFLEKNNEKISEGLYREDSVLKSRYTKQQYETILKNAGIDNYEINDYEETFGESKIYVKSGADKLLYLEITIHKD